MLLVDSTVYIDRLRRRVDLHRELEPWLRAGRLCSCGLVRVEVVRGIVHPAQRARMHEFFDLVPEVACTSSLWAEAADLAWRLDRGDKVLPLTDIVIAACALKADATVVTLDPHFRGIPGLKFRPDVPTLAA